MLALPILQTRNVRPSDVTPRGSVELVFCGGQTRRVLSRTLLFSPHSSKIPLAPFQGRETPGQKAPGWVRSEGSR